MTTFDRYPIQWGIVFGILAILPIGFFADILIRLHQIPMIDLLEAISSLSVTIGVLVALTAYLTNLKWRKKDKQNKKSEFYLQRAIDGLDIFYDLLKDRNNDRVTWVQAARVLLDNHKVVEKITNDVHQVVYELKEDHIRHQLYMVLHPKNTATGELAPLPPHFFYGINNWNENISIDDAARASTDPIEARRVEEYRLRLTPKLSSLSAQSIVAIYEFLKYPEDYEDRLRNVELWNLSQNECFDYLFESPWKYLKHRNDHVVNGSMCYPEGDDDARRREWERVHGELPPS